MNKLQLLLASWLALTAIGASAQGNATVGGERMPDQVQMSDGRTVTPIRMATRASTTPVPPRTTDKVIY